ncbi:MAG TPA: methyltransferase [Verrucomicrobiales bacterium]|nr:methyltransferase [Verrucomicrobiales bacterium]
MITRFLAPLFKLLGKDVYCADGLITVHNHDFLQDPAFQAAYARGLKADGQDYRFHWRVHVALWAARVASRLPGDFVECGVNRGFVSSALMHDLDWNALDKTFYLLDTFAGPDPSLLSPEERASGYEARVGGSAARAFYNQDVGRVQENFGPWKNVRIIQGIIPDTLSEVQAKAICFMHIDLNCSVPEVKALDTLWNRITPGGMILLDDYAYVGFRHSKSAMDALTANLGVTVLSLPTGQGLIVRPPA